MRTSDSPTGTSFTICRQSDSAFHLARACQQTVVNPLPRPSRPRASQTRRRHENQIKMAQGISGHGRRFADAKLSGYDVTPHILHPARNVVFVRRMVAGRAAIFPRPAHPPTTAINPIRPAAARRTKPPRHFSKWPFLEPVANLRRQRGARRRGNLFQRAADMFSQCGLGRLNVRLHFQKQ